MQTFQLPAFQVVGIKVRTQNNGDSLTAIPALWERFMNEQLASKIPHRMDSEILCIYTNYEGDHTQPYDTIIGCRVSRVETIPEGYYSQKFQDGVYTQFKAKGPLNEGVVYQSWLEIWNADLERKFEADFEVYDEKTLNPTDAEIPIFVSVHA